MGSEMCIRDRQTILHYTKSLADPESAAWWYGEDLLLIGNIFTVKEVTESLSTLSYDEFVSYLESFKDIQYITKT